MVKQTPFQLLFGMDQRYRKNAAALPAQQEAQESWSGIGFRMGPHYYVAPMNEVAEVLHEPRFTLLPSVKGWVRGVANVRGRLLPVLDLCGFLGMALTVNRKSRRLLVVEHQEIFAGLTVDAVMGMQHFTVDSFSQQAADVPDTVRPYIHGMFQRERNWLVFSPHALVMDAGFLDVVA